ncbi:unnamed protein product [Auanema sp. JU1783]|nr:unnamed protein product [Auanema sp. JU1783]
MSKSRRIHDVPDDIFLTFNSRLFGVEKAPVKISKDEQEWLLNSSVFGTAMYESKLFFSFFYGFWPNSEVYHLDDVMGKCLRATRDLEKNDLISGYYGFLRLYETAEKSEIFDTHSLKISEKLIYDGSIAAASSKELPGFQFFGTFAKHSKKHANSLLDVNHAFKGVPCYFLRASKNIAKGDQILCDYRHDDRKFNDNKEPSPSINFCPCESCYIPQQAQANKFNKPTLHYTPQQYEVTNSIEDSTPSLINAHSDRLSLRPRPTKHSRYEPCTLRYTPQQYEVASSIEESAPSLINAHSDRLSLRPHPTKRSRYEPCTLRYTPQQYEVASSIEESTPSLIHAYSDRLSLRPHPTKHSQYDPCTVRYTPQQYEVTNSNDDAAPPLIHAYSDRLSLRPRPTKHSQYDPCTLRYTPQQYEVASSIEESAPSLINAYSDRLSMRPHPTKRSQYEPCTVRYTPQQYEVTNSNDDAAPPLINADPVQGSFPYHDHDDDEFFDEDNLVTDDVNKNIENLPSQFMTVDAGQGLRENDYQVNNIIDNPQTQ